MIEIIPTKKMQQLLPHGLLNAKDPLLLCTRDKHGRVVVTEFEKYCASMFVTPNQKRKAPLTTGGEGDSPNAPSTSPR